MPNLLPKYLVAPEKSYFPDKAVNKIDIFNQQSVENGFLTTSKKDTIRKPLGAFGYCALRHIKWR
jgi:hypothetical protein